jgi:hypothetical protein
MEILHMKQNQNIILRQFQFIEEKIFRNG